MPSASSQPFYPTYYDANKQMHVHMDRRGRRMGYAACSPAEHAAWATQARDKFSQLLGLDLMKPVAPQPRMTGSEDCGDFVREHWLMRTEEEIVMPFYLLRPKGLSGRAPAVICPHGHGGGGKATVAGITDTPDFAAATEKFNWAYGVQFARAGFLAFCPDARGFGERQESQMRNKILESSCKQLSLMGTPLGIPVMGMWTFDLMRLVDHMQSRADVDPARIGCAGLSGGGLQTLALSALDTRIACAIVSGYFYGVGGSLLDLPGNCPCNIVPHLWEYFDMGDLGAMVAPRPLMIETGDADDLNGAAGLDNVYPQVQIASGAYRLLGKGENISHVVFPGPHRWYGEKAVAWMKLGLG